MKINGKERNFKLTIGASGELASICPDGDINRIGEVFEGDFAHIPTAAAKLVSTLNKWYEIDKAWQNGQRNIDKVDYLREVEVLALDIETFTALVNEAVATLNGDRKTEMKVEDNPGKKPDATDEEAEA